MRHNVFYRFLPCPQAWAAFALGGCSSLTSRLRTRGFIAFIRRRTSTDVIQGNVVTTEQIPR